MNIVVLGGSFNPPTRAHQKIMEAALSAVNAEKGIFIPVSNAYLKRKMRAANCPFVLSEELRYQMLSRICENDPRMSVSDMDFGLPMARTYEEMDAIKQQYPDSELFFLLGADKLRLCAQLAEYSDFFERFHVALIPRDSVAIPSDLNSYPELAAYSDRFVRISKFPDIEKISSSALRNAVMSGAEYESLLSPDVAALMKTVDLSDFREEITEFKGEYAFLDNRSPSETAWEGVKYSCVEAAFQASKSDDPETRKRFSEYRTDQLREKGRKLKPSPQWEEKKSELMKELLLIKFRDNPELAEKLKATGDRKLVFGVNGGKGDNLYWGTDLYSWTGENRLGELLMEVRDEI